MQFHRLSFDQAALNQVVTANAAFGLHLLTHLVATAEKRNIFFSPFSITTALTMTYNGAKAATQQAMATALGFDRLHLAPLNAVYAHLLARQTSNDPNVRVATANSLWVQTGLDLLTDFVERCQTAYGAQIALLDFAAQDGQPAAEAINHWARTQTQGMIDQLVTPGDVATSVLALVNAIYFKGRWQAPFDPDQTRPGSFTLLSGQQVPCPLMRRTGRYGYYEDQTVQAIALAYAGGQTHMYIVLPRPEVDFTHFCQELSVPQLGNWLSQLTPNEIELSLPRFRVEYSTGLTKPLGALGMGIAFTPQANFRGIAREQLMISQVIHKAALEVNEEGTTAAAATAVLMARGQPSRKQMMVNRPFLCMIADQSTGLIQFIGIIVDPQ